MAIINNKRQEFYLIETTKEGIHLKDTPCISYTEALSKFAEYDGINILELCEYLVDELNGGTLSEILKTKNGENKVKY